MYDFLVEYVMAGNTMTLVYIVLAALGAFFLVSSAVGVSSALGAKIKPWIALLVTGIGAIFLVLFIVVQVSMPDVIYDAAYSQGKNDHIGTPNPGCFSVVYNAEGQSQMMFGAGQAVDRVVEPMLDAEGNPRMNEDGKPLLRLIEGADLVKYILRAPPITERGYVHLWVGSSIYPEVHSCKLYQNQKNNDLAEGLKEAWEKVHGTEPEEPSEGEGEGEQGEGEQGEGEQSQGQGQQGQQGQGQGQGELKPNIEFTMPVETEQEGEVADEGEGESEGEGEGDQANAENQDPDQTPSSGMITIVPYDPNLPPKD
jgi:hypothetical protein